MSADTVSSAALEAAVDREAQQGRKTALLYTALLLIPLFVLAVMLIAGRTQQEGVRAIVVDEVRPVRAQVEEVQSLKPALDRFRQLEPSLGQAAKLSEQVQKIEQTQSGLQTSLQQLQSISVTPVVMAEVREEVNFLRAQATTNTGVLQTAIARVDQANNDLQAKAQLIVQLQSGNVQLQNQIADLRKSQMQLEQRLQRHDQLIIDIKSKTMVVPMGQLVKPQ